MAPRIPLEDNSLWKDNDHGHTGLVTPPVNQLQNVVPVILSFNLPAIGLISGDPNTHQPPGLGIGMFQLVISAPGLATGSTLLSVISSFPILQNVTSTATTSSTTVSPPPTPTSSALDPSYPDLLMNSNPVVSPADSSSDSLPCPSPQTSHVPEPTCPVTPQSNSQNPAQ